MRDDLGIIPSCVLFDVGGVRCKFGGVPNGVLGPRILGSESSAGVVLGKSWGITENLGIE